MNMSFGSILWQINPSELKISCERSVSKRLVPGFGESIQELGKGKRTVTGKGYLVGESCHREFMRLEEVFTLGCRDTLFLPGREPFDAMLTKLEAMGKVERHTEDASGCLTGSCKSCPEGKSCQREVWILR